MKQVRSITAETRFYVENPSNAKGKNHGRQPATLLTIFKSFGLQRRMAAYKRIISVKTLTRASATLRQKSAFIMGDWIWNISNRRKFSPVLFAGSFTNTALKDFKYK